MTTALSVNEGTVKPQVARRKRGCLFVIWRGVTWFSILLAVLSLFGVAYQTIATEQSLRNYAPRGQLYSVNGHQMHIICKGEGSPAVILHAGGAAESLYWYWVQNQLAARTRVCAFDRPGHGWSDALDNPPDARTMVSELHTLLDQAGIPAPYVMAGHSFGAVWARIYAQQYPEQIVGIALVDSVAMPKPFANQNEFDQWKTPQNVFQTVMWVAFRTGVARLLGPGFFQNAGYPAEIVPEMVALQARNQVFDTDYAEFVHGMWAFAEAAAHADKLGTLPMMVLWAGQGPMSGDNKRAIRDEIAAFSTNSTVRVVEGADHGSILGNESYAQQVTNAILDVIEAAQTGQPLSQ